MCLSTACMVTTLIVFPERDRPARTILDQDHLRRYAKRLTAKLKENEKRYDIPPGIARPSLSEIIVKERVIRENKVSVSSTNRLVDVYVQNVIEPKPT